MLFLCLESEFLFEFMIHYTLDFKENVQINVTMLK